MLRVCICEQTSTTHDYIRQQIKFFLLIVSLTMYYNTVAFLLTLLFASTIHIFINIVSIILLLYSGLHFQMLQQMIEMTG